MLAAERILVRQGYCVHVLSIASSGVLVVGGEVHDLAGGDGDISVVLGVAGADLGALGVEGDGDLTAGLGLLGGAGIVNDGLVVLVAAVLLVDTMLADGRQTGRGSGVAHGEVHAHDVQTGLAQSVDGLNRVGLGTDGADDGRAAVVLLGLVGSVEAGEPGDLSAYIKVVLSSSSHCEDLTAGYRFRRERWLSWRRDNLWSAAAIRSCLVDRQWRVGGGRGMM